MASILKVDDLRGNTSAGDITITSEGGAATMQLQQGLIKAWINLDGTGTIATLDSLNIASVTDDGSGAYINAFTNSFNNVNYGWNMSTMNNSSTNKGFIAGLRVSTTPTASQLQTSIHQNETGSADRDFVCTSAFGDLA